ncbi:MAG: NADH:ubiquinone reductase (Na(+)-transporting) subunit C [Alistipes sp.]|nr:NADH:ubiquinone reductase (Na(+)-transporting) subunit C [Alistipes sp.]
MAINKNSNAYIIIYTVVMVVIVGALLAFLATSLKGKQDANVLNEQKTSIMKAFGEADANFDEVVTMGRLTAGEFVAVEDDATVAEVFALLGNRKALGEATDELPIFKLEKDGITKYVLPIVGKGLWGDIWGYVALQQTEGNVEITGIVMDHAGETPGLGAEIATAKVQDMFKGKALYNAEGAFAVRMQKGGAQNEYQVDAITGGTKTCDGVNAMLETSIGKYESFLRGVEVEAVADVEECCEECCAEEVATEECCGECCDACEEATNVEPTNVVEE